MDDTFTLRVPPLVSGFPLPSNETGTLPIQGIVDLVSREDFFLFHKSVSALRLALCLLGTWTNGLSLRTFHRMGLEDSVTVVFFLLAVSDFLHLLGSLLGSFFIFAGIVEREGVWMKHLPNVLTIVMYTSLRAFPEITYLSTTFLAIQRCLCVVRPLHFKGIFTRGRTGLVIFFIWLFCLTIALLLSGYTGSITMVQDPRTNLSKYVLNMKPGRKLVNDVTQTIFFIVLSTANQLIVTVCVFVMANALKRSLHFRQGATASAGARPQDVPQVQIRSQSEVKPKTPKPASQQLGQSKEKQAIIQVSLVCLIFLACNFFRVVLAFVSMGVPEFTVYGKLHNTFSLFYNVLILFEYINSTANFFVYFKYNSRFRRLCFGQKTSTQ